MDCELPKIKWKKGKKGAMGETKIIKKKKEGKKAFN